MDTKIKVGLITTHFTINFGAVLQAYALQNAIKQCGYYCEIVDYSPSGAIYGNKINYNFSTVRSAVSSVLLFLNKKYRGDLERKRDKFFNFLKTECTLSKKKYTSYIDLKNNLEQYDVLVCGSDQIWNLNLLDDKAYFLMFQEIYPKTKYVAYAPSISESLTEQQYDELIKRVTHFSSISVREKSDAAILSRLLGKNIINVLDPVFLMDKKHWTEKIKLVITVEEPYILCFEVASDKRFSLGLEILRKKLPFKVVCINSKPYNKYNADVLLTDVSPQEFLGLINNAAFVYTSSFHATAFSIIFEKQFFTVANANRRARHQSLLEQLNLGDRLINNIEKFKESLIIDINYDDIAKNVISLRKSSLVYLKNALKDAK